jgi:oxalate decarboxylase/phosphoglucose isomerase-like protein (cupin superfamily)
LVDLPALGDARGGLVAIEANRHIPFDITRVYYLYDVTPGGVRGEHAHKALEQVYIAVHGRFEVVLEDGHDSRRFTLERPDQGLYIGHMVWRRLEAFSPGAVCLVLASAPYDEADYYRDKAAFLRDARQP